MVGNLMLRCARGLRSLWPLATCMALLSCGGSDGSASSTPPPSTANQTLSMAIDTPNSSQPFTAQELDDAITLAQGAGVHAVIATYTWSSLEPTPGNIDVSSLKSALDYYNQKGFQILVGIQVINTVKREVPTDLAAVAFDDPQFIARFHTLLDAVSGVFSGAERYISIGNEVDVYLSSQPAEWATYKTFYTDAVSYLHTQSPTLLVGVTATFGGFSGDSNAELQSLNAPSDVTILTYYPLQGDSQGLPSSSPTTDIPRMLSLAGSKPVVLQEAGYPSGTLNGSSEAAQQEFVTDLFQAWRAAGDRMPFLSYFLLYDFDSTTCNDLGTYYGSSDPAFLSYLCTLGLRHSDGTPKPAWNTFVTAAQ